MVAVRERIRINGKPLSEDKFAKYFFDVWDRFEENREVGCFAGGSLLAALIWDAHASMCADPLFPQRE